MKTYIIAEAGVNHNGSFEMATKLIDVAVASGAHAVKFQTFISEEVIAKDTPKCGYQIEQTGADESQLEMIQKLQLSFEQKKQLFDYGRSKGVEVLSTPFDLQSLEFLLGLNMSRIKIASGEITNPLLLLNAGKSQKPVILSTGMSTLKDIQTALEILVFGYLGNGDEPSYENFTKAFCTDEGQKLLKEKVTILHCTTNYPAPYDELNLNVIETMQKAFRVDVGYSDHSKGFLASCIAVSKGATIIEKHFTLDNSLPGPDHKASLNPQDLKDLVANIKLTEEMLGRSEKIPSHGELETAALVRRSVVAGKNIAEGEIFTEENLKLKRPGTGLGPENYFKLIGTKSKKVYKLDDFVQL